LNIRDGKPGYLKGIPLTLAYMVEVCGLWFVVCGLWFVVCGLWFVVCGL